MTPAYGPSKSAPPSATTFSTRVIDSRIEDTKACGQIPRKKQEPCHTPSQFIKFCLSVWTYATNNAVQYTWRKFIFGFLISCRINKVQADPRKTGSNDWLY